MLQMGATQTFSSRSGAKKDISSNQQSWDGQILGGTQAPSNDELFQAFRQAYGTSVTTTNVDSYRLFIKSLCLDVQITNTGDKNLVFEVYHIRNRKTWNRAERLDVMLTEMINENDAQTGFSFTATDPGYTLFQLPEFCQYWQITKKQQIVLSPNETTTMQIRIPFNRMLNGKLIESSIQALPRFARGLFWSCKGAPELNDAADNVQYADGSYCWLRQTTVNYQIAPGSTTARSSTT